MATMRDLMLADLNDSLRYYQGKITDLVEAVIATRTSEGLDVELPEGSSASGGPKYGHVYAPYSHARNDELIAALTDAGWEVTSSREKLESSEAGYDLGAWATLRLGDNTIYVTFDPQRGGATCRVVKTGTKVVEQDLFRVECNPPSEAGAPAAEVEGESDEPQ
jgi:hypothetical protein